MSTSPLCWKCANPLRAPNATFCHACGSAQKPDSADDKTAGAWQAHLRATEHTSAAWRLLWLLTGPLAVLLFPFHLAAATRRLRAHIRKQLTAPAFATARFKDAPEGVTIARRLATSAGKLSSNAVLPAIGCLLLIVGLLALQFLSPLAAPSTLDYGQALDSIMNGGRYYHNIYVASENDYAAAWAKTSVRENVSVNEYEEYSSYPQYSKNFASAPVYDTSRPDTASQHRPYRYRREDSFSKSSGRLYHVGSLGQTIHFGQGIGIALIIGWLLVGLIYLLLGIQFWRRFARHAAAEAFAAAYARGTPALLDQLLPPLKTMNAVIIILGILLAITQLQLVLLPFTSAVIFAGHEKWERANGVSDALGA